MPELQYKCFNGQIWTSLLAASVSLCDHNPGDGGFCVVRGSHKLNLPVPDRLANGMGEDFVDHVHQPSTKAGDVIIWSEATVRALARHARRNALHPRRRSTCQLTWQVHGATPWLAKHQRRIAIYRFAPANMGYGRGYLDVPETALSELTDLQRAVVEPPYAIRLDRPLVTPRAVSEGGGSGPPEKRARAEHKKAFDQQLFGTSYF